MTFVAGQLLFKAAASEDEEDAPPAAPARPAPRRALTFAVGIVCMTISFFANLHLLKSLELSFLFPFQGLSVLIVTLGASLFLRERLTAPLVIGTLLITAGVVLVSTS